uniref:Uncharacterized protein n=1 Tax=Rhipicephalus zambeziensis TaxID=60191 RepID=A0A224Y6X4_9ACAR
MPFRFLMLHAGCHSDHEWHLCLSARSRILERKVANAEFSRKETRKTHYYVLFGDQTRPYRCNTTGAKPIGAAALQYLTWTQIQLIHFYSPLNNGGTNYGDNLTANLFIRPNSQLGNGCSTSSHDARR